MKARDDAHRLMCDRMTRPKDFHPITGKRLVNDALDVGSLTDDEIFQLAKRLAGPMCVGVPENWTGTPKEAEEDNGLERQDRDNRRPHFKPSVTELKP